ncbi:M24 family metallopeptidase [Hwanghaeella sp.]|uniref:M24 family metallopeptidase n=1 Tax=Hwanghaeella sp. TaxID=2605943 RepID=UPI003CCC0834
MEWDANTGPWNSPGRRSTSIRCGAVNHLSYLYPSLIHGVGLADEYPSIKHAVDWETRGIDGTLQEGMTLCVESFIGVEGGREGVKLEEQVLITDKGAVPLSTYPYELAWL